MQACEAFLMRMESSSDTVEAAKVCPSAALLLCSTHKLLLLHLDTHSKVQCQPCWSIGLQSVIALHFSSVQLPDLLLCCA